MIGAISKGVTSVKGLLDCDDCNYTIGAFRDMGIEINRKGALTIINGKGLKGLSKPAGPINAGNSGTTVRLLTGILAGQDFESVLESDEALSKRPMGRVTDPISRMGADIETAPGGHPPIKIKPARLKAVDYRMPIPSAQVKSAILLAGLYPGGTTSIEEKFISRDHTERMLKYFGARLNIEGRRVSITGGAEIDGRSLEIPADVSSASFFIAGAILLKGSKIKIRGVGINPTRAGILDVLPKMGARINITNRRDHFEPVGDIEVSSGRTHGIVIGEDTIPSLIDELPVIFVLASLSEGRTVIKGADELKVKETDRIISMKGNLEKMGARIDISGSDITIEGVDALKPGALLKSFGDHRTCMSMVIAALTAGGKNSIDDISCVGKSFPEFFETLNRLSA